MRRALKLLGNILVVILIVVGIIAYNLAGAIHGAVVERETGCTPGVGNLPARC